ncbi:hypothetical protein [Anaeromyxobacter paludicola]|uniref:Uncharacterized protein n=1 Tax=Anaeromyxobacter paludicola TaxID=2918171 RepID=A0ABN6N2B9_9BACT|nr:hypothetical protein [Anaeromyxobacter paludicola]BDG07359.1 hypothetical protein AMPC_04720 [Anaeromyxobacter paludicola]
MTWLRYMSLVALVLAPVVTWPAPAGVGGALRRWALRLGIWAGASLSLWFVVAPWCRELLATGRSSDRFGAPIPLALALAVGLAGMRAWAAGRPAAPVERR